MDPSKDPDCKPIPDKKQKNQEDDEEQDKEERLRMKPKEE